MNGYAQGLVPVRWYDDPMEAHLARCLLENEGIEAFVHDEHIIGLNRALSYALGQVKLKVHETDRTRALEVLDITEHRPYLDEDGHPFTCTACGSSDLEGGVLKPGSVSGLLNWALALLFAVYPLSVDRHMRCRTCGHFIPERGKAH